MKAAIYNPYLDTLGGGERYAMAVATTLAKRGYRVEVEWPDPTIAKKIEERFGIKLDNIHFVKSVEKGSNYDLMFWVSDGSIPLLSARHNYIHFQVPFKLRESTNLITRMKLMRIKKVVCNSQFTKKFIDKSYGVNSIVLYPPVDTNAFKPKLKENIILYIGRFSELLQNKHQDILIENFKKFCEIEGKKWKLILAGGTDVGEGGMIEKLKSQADGYPIEILPSPKFRRVAELSGKAKIFWSASGFGIDESKDPQKVEHFGITLVEAMSAKCIPLVFNAGGHKEIVKDLVNGFLWSTEDELLQKTQMLISNPKMMRTLAIQAHFDSQEYNYDSFEKKLISLL